MKRPIEVAPELVRLHRHYITEDKKPRYEWPGTSLRDLNHDEIYESPMAVHSAPRIGRLGNGRERDDELIAIPRGLANYLVDQMRDIEISATLWKENYYKEREKREEGEK